MDTIGFEVNLRNLLETYNIGSCTNTSVDVIADFLVRSLMAFEKGISERNKEIKNKVEKSK